MKRKIIGLFGLILAGLSLASCGKNDKNIRIAASQLPHAKILTEAVAPVLEKKGYTLTVDVLDWTIQNSQVAVGDYDANYFQHAPYLETYNSSVSDNEKLEMVCKVHFEKLCLYASDTNNKNLKNGDSIEIVNDISNIERALLLLQNNNILTINQSCYNENNEFVNFNITNPLQSVTFTENYSNCTLTCLAESVLTTSLADYNFGVIPGNTALTGLGSEYAKRIVLSETISKDVLDLRSNGIAVRKENANSDKIKALVEAFKDESVATYINNTFGESVVYNFIDLLK